MTAAHRTIYRFEFGHRVDVDEVEQTLALSILAVGCLRGRDPDEMLSALRADEFDIVICCTAPSPRGMPAAEVAAAARRLGCDDVREVPTVESACATALRDATAEDAILLTGSLYVVGAARSYLRERLTG